VTEPAPGLRGPRPAAPQQGHAPADGLLVRASRPEDSASLLEGLRSVVAERKYFIVEDAPWTVEMLASEALRLSDPAEGAALVAVSPAQAGGDSGPVLGYCRLIRGGPPHTDHLAELGIWVIARQRGAGVGRALLEASVRWAERSGVRKLQLGVFPHNGRAIGLYASMGFGVEGLRRGQYRKSYGFEDELLMARWVGPPPAPVIPPS
jgi:ribosomal protein S18 acetylase RimI-like enzyme